MVDGADKGYNIRDNPTKEGEKQMKKILAFAALALGLAATGRLWATEVTWKSSVTEGNWNEASNWDGGSVPGESDTAKFSSSATVTINMSGNTLCYIASIVIDEGATVTFKGSGNETNPRPLYLGGNITGSGKLRFAGGLIFQANKAIPEIEPDIEIVAETTSQLNMNYSGSKNMSCYFKLKGKLTGSGTLIGWHSNDTDNYGIEFSGDNSAFAGVYEVQDGNGASSTRDKTVFANASATSASATWNLIGAYSNSSSSWADMLPTKPTSASETVTYNFGAISNIYTTGNSTYTISNSGNGGGNISCTIVNIGGNNQDSATGGDLGGATLHKTGTGTLTLTAKKTYATFIDAGTLYISSSDSAPQDGRLIFNGEGATLATSTSFDISKYNSKQPLKGNSQYPICFSNATSEVHYWATPLDDSNTAGLRKIGDGALHLGEAPSYSALPITVEGGTLAINGSINAANVTLKPADPAAAARAGTVLFWAKTVSSGTPTLDSSLTALYRLKTTTDASLAIHGTECTGTAYSIEKRGGFVISIAENKTVEVPLTWDSSLHLDAVGSASEIAAAQTTLITANAYGVKPYEAYLLGYSSAASADRMMGATVSGGNIALSFAGAGIPPSTDVTVTYKAQYRESMTSGDWADYPATGDHAVATTSTPPVTLAFANAYTYTRLVADYE